MRASCRTRWALAAVFALGLTIPSGAAGFALYLSTGTTDGDVRVFDTRTNVLTNPGINGLATGTVPMVASPDGRTLYLGSGDGVRAVDTRNDRVVAGPISADGRIPFAITITPDGGRVYVSALDRIVVINTATSMQAAPSIATSGNVRQNSVVADPGGSRVFFVDDLGLRVIDTATNTASGSVNNLGGVTVFPKIITVNPTGTLVYVAQSNQLSVIDAATFATVATLPMSSPEVSDLTVSPDGSRLYASSELGDEVSVIDTATNSFAGPDIPVGNINPLDLAITPDGASLYVGGDSLSMVDTATNTVTQSKIAGGDTKGGPALGDLAISTRDPAGALPPPAVGETVIVAPVEGKVTTKCPGDKGFKDLKKPDQIKVGCLVDVRDGRVRLTSAAGKKKLQTLDFYDGLFQIAQKKGGANPTTELVLPPGTGCGKPKPGGRSTSASAYAKGGKGNGLWGSGKGNVKTQGSSGSASVRGTTWLTEDRCDGSTFFRVEDGAVKVRDDVKGKTVTLRKGDTYLAKAAKRKGRRR